MRRRLRPRPSASPRAGGLTAPSSRVVSTITRTRSGSMPSSSMRPARRRCARLDPSRSSSAAPSTVPSGGSARPQRTISKKPLPRPEFFNPSPSPTARPDATAVSYAGLIVSRHRCAPRQPSSMIWPGPQTSPGWITLRKRISQPLMPTISASRSSAPSIANWLVRAEARNAPHRVVRARRKRLDVDRRSRYGPLACPAARSSTFMPTDAYGPESPTIRARSAVKLPPVSQPTVRSMRIGCRLVWISNDSSARQRALDRCVEQERGERSLGWFAMSSLPPNAPPLETSTW